jgi:glutaminyl-tRNA synthetase
VNNFLPASTSAFLSFQVVVTNLESGLVMDLDAKKWPDASTEDSSAFYKVSFWLKPFMYLVKM